MSRWWVGRRQRVGSATGILLEGPDSLILMRRLICMQPRRAVITLSRQVEHPHCRKAHLSACLRRNVRREECWACWRPYYWESDNCRAFACLASSHRHAGAGVDGKGSSLS